jgi:hypothetical protein
LVLSPGKQITESKQPFDLAFRKETWVIHPTIITFLTPIEVKDAKQNKDGSVLQGLLPLIAPVNHNKLNPAKMYQILHTIIGNPYQDYNETARANEDFGNDASITVGFHDNTIRRDLGQNRAYMNCLHPEDDIDRDMLFRRLFPPDNDIFNSTITSSEFKKLLKTDATTEEGLKCIADYFNTGDSTYWKEGKNTMEQYFKLLCQIKDKKPKEDCVWILFWEGMHRHAASIMALLNAKLSHDTNKCYVPNTLEHSDFDERAIKGYSQIFGQDPGRIIGDIFRQDDNAPKMLRTEMTINAYIPIDHSVKITELMKAVTEQSRHLSENKLNSAKLTVSSALAEWLLQCSPDAVITVKPDKEPVHEYQITLHTALTPKKYYNLFKGEVGEGVDSWFGWYPTFLKKSKWSRYVENPFDEDRKRVFDMKDRNKNDVRPPYRSTLRSITADVVPDKKEKRQFIDRRHFNAYQIIPGIMYKLIARLSGRVQSHVINEVGAVQAIHYVTRYCHATRSAPFDTMHPACVSYNLKFNL